MASASPSNGRTQIAGLMLLLGAVMATSAAGLEVTPAPCGSRLGLNSDQISHRLAVNNAERAQHLHNFEVSDSTPSTTPAFHHREALR